MNTLKINIEGLTDEDQQLKKELKASIILLQQGFDAEIPSTELSAFIVEEIIPNCTECDLDAIISGEKKISDFRS